MHDRILLAPEVGAGEASEIITAAQAPPGRFGTVMRVTLVATLAAAVVGVLGFLFPPGSAARNLVALLVIAFMLAMVTAGLGLLRLALAGWRRARTAEQRRLLQRYERDYVDVNLLPWDNRHFLRRAMERVRERFGTLPPVDVYTPLWKAARANREAHAVILEHRGNVLRDPQTLERTWREAGAAFRQLAGKLACDPADFWTYGETAAPDLAWCAGPVGYRPPRARYSE